MSEEKLRTRSVLEATGFEFQVQRQDHDCIHILHYQTATADPAVLEAYCYTDRISYEPGAIVSIHASSTAGTVSIEIFRDGSKPVVIASFADVAVQSIPTPENFYTEGCGWPVALRWRIPDDATSGFYIMRMRATRNGRSVQHDHGICIRKAKGAARSPVLFILSTCTWTAYNDWGGINNYIGADPPDGFHFAPRLTLHRPYARGLIWQPGGAPRIVPEGVPRIGDTPRYPAYEWAYAKGFSKFFCGAGWATYERNFAIWAESQGLQLDFATQHDLDADPTLLAGYKCVVIVGHCEYWSARMRDAIDTWIEQGGNVARFAGNFMWQIRLEDEGLTQVCYKELANAADPVATTARSHLTTTMWEDPKVGRPGSLTFGLQSVYGIYARVGAAVPRGSGGFITYRPEHWAFADADLYYGDTFGEVARIFGFELDGLDYEFRDGLPFPKASDAIPDGLEILAMNVVSPVETDHRHPTTKLFVGDVSAPGIARFRYGSSSAEHLSSARRGSGMIVSFRKGKGEVFHAGASEWVNGLRLSEPFTKAITRTVIWRLAGLGEAQ